MLLQFDVAADKDIDRRTCAPPLACAFGYAQQKQLAIPR